LELPGAVLDLRFRRAAGARRAGARCGAEEERGTLDVGYGLAPDLMGGGLGPRFVEAMLEFAFERYDPERLRLYILEWNERSRKLATSHGFAVKAVLASDEGPFLGPQSPSCGL
jgi:RimJ/RimL family protein N-acetyltransferase